MPQTPEFLQILLTGDPKSNAYQEAAKQLESRPELQKSLEALARGQEAWWDDLESVLSQSGLPAQLDAETTSVLVEVESQTEDEAIECEPVSLDFLDAPRHPELLGRLGRYEIERVLGTGGMGIVLRGFDTDLHRVVAVKVLAPHLAHSHSARRRFAREAQAAAAVVHPHVIPIFNVDSEGRIPFLVMQYVNGTSLQKRVDHGGPLATEDALRIAHQTAGGLAAAHAQGLVHRDVKPANILLEEDLEKVLLSDFGLARAVDDASLTKTGIVAGTPHYMSPEQALGENIDHRSDLFGLGSVLYFMLAGRPPFLASGAMAVLHRICRMPHQPLLVVNPNVPPELAKIVDDLLAKDPEQRIQSAEQVEQLFNRMLHDAQSKRIPNSVDHWPEPNQEVTPNQEVAPNQESAPIANAPWWAWTDNSDDRSTTFGSFRQLVYVLAPLIFLGVVLGGLMWRLPWSAPQLPGSSSPSPSAENSSSSVTGASSSAVSEPGSSRVAMPEYTLSEQMQFELFREQSQDTAFVTQLSQTQSEISELTNSMHSSTSVGDDFDAQVRDIQMAIQSLRELD